jgi:murein DD-endopeptidase MepM/ murein hydrolase activator NlpD
VEVPNGRGPNGQGPNGRGPNGRGWLIGIERWRRGSRQPGGPLWRWVPAGALAWLLLGGGPTGGRAAELTDDTPGQAPREVLDPRDVPAPTTRAILDPRDRQVVPPSMAQADPVESEPVLPPAQLPSPIAAPAVAPAPVQKAAPVPAQPARPALPSAAAAAPAASRSATPAAIGGARPPTPATAAKAPGTATGTAARATGPAAAGAAPLSGATGTTAMKTLISPPGLLPPVLARISQRFGENGHTGVDLAAPLGTPVRAAASGTVVQAAKLSYGYGWRIRVDHGQGMLTLYAHLKELDVVEGQRVTRGQVIGAVGSTGFSTGPHLHFEVRINGQARDPAQYVDLVAR